MAEKANTPTAAADASCFSTFGVGGSSLFSDSLQASGPSLSAFGKRGGGATIHNHLAHLSLAREAPCLLTQEAEMQGLWQQGQVWQLALAEKYGT